jgi:hypothetical protein
LLDNCDIKKQGIKVKNMEGTEGFRQVWVKCSVLVPLIFKNYEQSNFFCLKLHFFYFLIPSLREKRGSG